MSSPATRTIDRRPPPRRQSRRVVDDRLELADAKVRRYSWRSAASPGAEDLDVGEITGRARSSRVVRLARSPVRDRGGPRSCHGLIGKATAPPPFAQPAHSRGSGPSPRAQGGPAGRRALLRWTRRKKMPMPLTPATFAPKTHSCLLAAPAHTRRTRSGSAARHRRGGRPAGPAHAASSSSDGAPAGVGLLLQLRRLTASPRGCGQPRRRRRRPSPQ